MNDTTTPKDRDLDADPGDAQEIRILMRRILVDHAISLDRMYLDLAEYAAQLFGDSPGAAQNYLRLALRAQSGCRSALQTVVRCDRIDEKAASEAEACSPHPPIAAPPANGAHRPRPAAAH